MGIYAGVDCGTQSTKVILIDAEKGIILGEGYSSHNLISNSNGKREQHPEWWTIAFKDAFSLAIKNAGINSRQIDGISISGQQHGLVILDKGGKSLYPVKLWCDTETANENSILLEKIGGIEQCLNKLGLVIATGYTASKILWIRQHHPDIWQNIHTIFLPHNYLNYWLTGVSVMEFGDASGTGLFNVYTQDWADDVIDIIDEGSNIVKNALPKVVKGNTKIGTVKEEIASLLNLRSDVIVASGSGDNMLGALGTGNISPGLVTMSLGTSGTLYTHSDKPLIPPSELIANFCSYNDEWLPLICTMNVTSVTTLIQEFLDVDLLTFNQALEHSRIGAGGIISIPFFNGERTPALPTATASIYGLNSNNFTQNNFCRAIVEGITFGLRYGLDLFKERGIEPKQIRLIGGGSKSSVWRKIVADIMNCEVICLSSKEAAALGAAIQAATVHKSILEPSQNKKELLKQLTEKFVTLDQTTLTKPNIDNVNKYENIYLEYKKLLTKNYLEN